MAAVGTDGPARQDRGAQKEKYHANEVMARGILDIGGNRPAGKASEGSNAKHVN